MKRTFAIVLATAALAACAETPMGLGASSSPPSSPPPAYAGPTSSVFQARDFAWSTAPGAASISGALTYHAGPLRYSCQGKDVILIPETPWTRLRMIILYGSAANAAVPLDVVRARTPSTSAGDYASYVKKATCDGANRFSFSGLPDGGWYVITIARPTDGSDQQLALMRRVETHGGPRAVTLN